MTAPAKSGMSIGTTLDGHDCTKIDHLHDLVAVINQSGSDDDPSLPFELAAFRPCERDDSAPLGEWGGRFLPILAERDESGSVRPTVAEVMNADMVKYWARRAEDSPNALLRARYADLVWEFGHVARMGSRGKFAIRAFDAYAEIGAADSGLRLHIRHSALARCLELARSLNDTERQTKAAIRIAEEGASAQPHTPFWAARLLSERGDARLVNPIVSSSLEGSMQKLIGEGQSPANLLQPAMLIEWVGWLVAYRRARGIGAHETKTIVADLAAAVLGSAGKMAGLIALDALHRLRELAATVGLDRELGAIDAAIRDAGIRAGENMVTVSVPMDNLDAEIKRFLDWAIGDELAASFVRVVIGPLPSQAAVDSAAQNSMGQVESLFTHTSVTDDGRPGSVSAGSGLDQVRLRRGRELGLAIARLFTRLGMERLRAKDPRWTRSLALLLQGCAPRSMQDPQTNHAISLAFRHRNWPVATTLLVLRIEPLLVELARAKDVHSLRSNASGGLNAAGIDGLIAKPEMRAAMGEKLEISIKHVFDEQGLRHSVAHGQRRDAQFTEDDAITGMQAVVGLGAAFARTQAKSPVPPSTRLPKEKT